MGGGTKSATGWTRIFALRRRRLLGVNPASARAEFAALLDVYVEQNLYDFHGVRPLQGETIH